MDELTWQCHSYQEYSSYRKREYETQNKLREMKNKLKQKLLDHPEDGSAQQNLKTINEALAQSVSGLSSPEDHEQDAMDTLEPDSQAGIVHPELASVHIEGITGFSGVPLGYDISPINTEWIIKRMQVMKLHEGKNKKKKKRKKRIERDHKNMCASVHDQISGWQSCERTKVAMFLEAREGHVKGIIDYIKKHGINNSGCNVDIVRLLAEDENERFIQDKNGKTLLHWICQHGYSKDVASLLQKGLNMNAKDAMGQTALHLACIEGHIEVVAALLSEGVDLDIVDKSYYGRTALHNALQYEHKSIAKALISLGADLKYSNRRGHSALHIACHRGFSDLALQLAGAGADLSVCDSDGLTPVHLAIAEGHGDLIKKLLEHYGSVLVAFENRTGDTSSLPGFDPRINYLHYSIFNNKDNIAGMFIDAGADIEMQMRNGCSPLHFAVCRESIPTIKKLLQKTNSGPALCAAQDKFHRTPLHYAEKIGHVDIIHLLVQAGADVGNMELIIRQKALDSARRRLQETQDMLQAAMSRHTQAHIENLQKQEQFYLRITSSLQ